MTPFLLLRVPSLLCSQPAGTRAWDLAHSHGLIWRKCWPALSSCWAWRFLPNCTLSWCQGPDIILTHVLGLWHRLRFQGNMYKLRRQHASWIWGRGETTIAEKHLPKKTANDTEGYQLDRVWAPLPLLGMPSTVLTDVLLPQWGFHCFFVVGRKLHGHFKDESRIPLRKRG